MAPVFIRRYGPGGHARKYSELYGFRVDQNKTDPAQIITYIEDNKDYTPAKMDFDAKKFDYGSWANAFFMKTRPCILNYDGTVKCYLNPDDNTQDVNGNTVAIDINCSGNVMVEFPRIYWKIVDNGDDTADVYVCDGRKDKGFNCWSHLDANGNEIDYCYLPVFEGYTEGNGDKLRSVSGVNPSRSRLFDTATAIAYAKNNYPDEEIWFPESFADMTMVDILLVLIGKTTDGQAAFGQGLSRGSGNATDIYTLTANNGILNKSGMFYCATPNKYGGTPKGSGMKVFGMEHWWGNASRRTVGLIRDTADSVLVKMTHSMEDGSSTVGFNGTGEGYIKLPGVPSPSAAGYIAKMHFLRYGFLASAAGGSCNTGYTDYATRGTGGLVHGHGVTIWNGTTAVSYDASYNSRVGIFSEKYLAAATVTPKPSKYGEAPMCFCLTCKPLRK